MVYRVYLTHWVIGECQSCRGGRLRDFIALGISDGVRGSPFKVIV